MLLIIALDPVMVGLDYQLEDPGLTTLEYADLFGPLHEELGFPPARQFPDFNFGLESGPSMMDSSTFNDSTQRHPRHSGPYPTTSELARNNPRGPQLPNPAEDTNHGGPTDMTQPRYSPNATGSHESDFPSLRTQLFNVR
jgi:hypothetical protein